MANDIYSFAFPIDTIITYPVYKNENLRIIETSIEMDKNKRISRMYHIKGVYGTDNWINAIDLEKEGKVKQDE